MSSISPDINGLYHPTDESEIIALINRAVQNNLQVRVRGAAQSVTAAVYTDGYNLTSPSAGTNINIELDQMRGVTFDDANRQATVGGGCNLGWDPYDPSGTSKKDDTNNLLFQLNAKGWALQNVPDAAHQTIAGYISTGSQAGSMMHSFDDCIVSIRVVDGTGTAKTYTKSSDLNDTFYAVGVSMGLLGIITSVTIQCVPAFDIIGQEKTTPENECEFNFPENGNTGIPSLEQYITDTEFSRLLWWPFPTLKRMIAWKARTMQASDYDSKTSGSPDNFTPKPYQPVFPKLFGSTLPAQTVAGIGFRIIANYPELLWEIFGTLKSVPDLTITDFLEILKDLVEKKPISEDDKEKIGKYIIDKISPHLYRFMIDMYFPCSSDKHPAQQFWDYWNGSLPMDTVEFSNDLFNLVYTEFWVSMADANKAITVLNDFYEAQGMSLTSYYTIEILASKSSKFWMSPSYNQDVMRLNIMRFDTNITEDLAYYQQFWDLLKTNGINFKLHWGKFLPPPYLPKGSPTEDPKPNPEGPGYLAGQYPRWSDFLNVRSQMDPHNVFLTSYWKSQLGIT